MYGLTPFPLCTSSSYHMYNIARNFGRELNLVVWWTAWATAKLKSAKLSYLHILYVWRSCTELPHLNPPIRLQWQFGIQPPNLISTNIYGYTVHKKYNFSLTKEPLIVDLSLYENNLFKPNRNLTYEHNDEDSPFSSSRQPDTWSSVVLLGTWWASVGRWKLHYHHGTFSCLQMSSGQCLESSCWLLVSQDPWEPQGDLWSVQNE